MSDEVDSNRWQTRIKSLKQGIHHIYDTKEFSDVVFKVEGVHFKAHKLVLSARCSGFAQILLGPGAVDGVEYLVEEETVTKVGFENLLHFIYKDDLANEEKKSVVEAYLASKYYKQSALLQRCVEIMNEWSFTVDEVCPLLNSSLNIPMLRDKCIRFIKEHATEVISSPGFLELNFNSLHLILKDGILDDIPVFTRIEKVIQWGASHHTKPVNYSLVRQDMLVNVPPMLGLLGFHTLSYGEIAKIVSKYKDFLEATEVVSFMAFKESGDMSVLPEWAQVAE